MVKVVSEAERLRAESSWVVATRCGGLVESAVAVGDEKFFPQQQLLHLKREARRPRTHAERYTTVRNGDKLIQKFKINRSRKQLSILFIFFFKTFIIYFNFFKSWKLPSGGTFSSYGNYQVGFNFSTFPSHPRGKCRTPLGAPPGQQLAPDRFRFLLRGAQTLRRGVCSSITSPAAGRVTLPRIVASTAYATWERITTRGTQGSLCQSSILTPDHGHGHGMSTLRSVA